MKRELHVLWYMPLLLLFIMPILSLLRSWNFKEGAEGSSWAVDHVHLLGDGDASTSKSKSSLLLLGLQNSQMHTHITCLVLMLSKMMNSCRLRISSFCFAGLFACHFGCASLLFPQASSACISMIWCVFVGVPDTRAAKSITMCLYTSMLVFVILSYNSASHDRCIFHLRWWWWWLFQEIHRKLGTRNMIHASSRFIVLSQMY